MISREDDGPVQPPRPVERPAAARAAAPPPPPAARAAAPAAAPPGGPPRRIRSCVKSPSGARASFGALRSRSCSTTGPRTSKSETGTGTATGTGTRRTSYRPRRRGGLVAVLLVGAALAIGFYFVWPEARERLAGALGDAPPPRAETATPAVADPPPNRIEHARPLGNGGQRPDPRGGRPDPIGQGANPTLGRRGPGGARANRIERAGSLADGPVARNRRRPRVHPRAAPGPRNALGERFFRRDAGARPGRAGGARFLALGVPASAARGGAPPDRSPDPAPRSVRSQRLPSFRRPARRGQPRAQPRGHDLHGAPDRHSRPAPRRRAGLAAPEVDRRLHSRRLQLDPVSPAGSYQGAVAGGHSAGRAHGARLARRQAHRDAADGLAATRRASCVMIQFFSQVFPSSGRRPAPIARSSA